MCLPRCPTFRLTGSESESPRGRISLAAALARGDLAPDPALAGHLESCLVCRACENSCPSGVAYGRLITAARQLLREAGTAPEPGAPALLTEDGLGHSVLRRAARAWSGSSVQGLVRRHHLLGDGAMARLEGMLPTQRVPAPTAGFHPAIGAERGRIQLFVGCTGDIADSAALAAGVDLLRRLGYGVDIPPARCCGALDFHAGRRDAADLHMARVLDGYRGDVPLIAIASGCAGFLHEYDRWSEDPAAATLVTRVREITAFLADQDDLEALAPEHSGDTVAVHEPCSMQHVLHLGGTTARLLQRLGFDARPLGGGDDCCGAAGEYMLRHPGQAADLRTPHIEALADSGARYLVSANVGCARHLAAGARAAGLEIEVLHPVALIHRHLRPASVADSA